MTDLSPQRADNESSPHGPRTDPGGYQEGADGGARRRTVVEPVPIAWAILLVVLLGWSALHLGATELVTTVTATDGSLVEGPNTFATVDHPWHVARAQTLIDSLRDGELLRWVGSHQGGYPVEFYPLGVPWLTVVAWALLLGAFPVASAFKLVVVGIFLAPVFAFGLLGRRDGAVLATAGLGLVAHLAVPGEWWSGGYTETVEWGLITNVAAYVAAFGFLGALLGFVQRPGRATLVLAIGLSVFAVGTNTRSVIALGCVVCGVVISLLVERGVTVAEFRRLVVRLAVVGLPAALIATPLWLNALRFGDLYVFIRYEFYADLGAWWSSSLIAVSWPVMILALVGLALGLVGEAGPATRAATWTLVAYVAATLILGGLGEDGGLVPQLEATRLMPFQRLLTIYLAAATVVLAARWLQRWTRAARLVGGGLVLLTAALALLFVARPPAFVPAEQRSMFAVERTASAEFADLHVAVREADGAAPPGTAIFLAGSELGWHQPMWAPLATDRPLRYNDWLWLWQTWHRSPELDYDGQAIDPSSLGLALERDYLGQQGIGAVIALTPQVQAIADSSASLQRIDGPGYAVYVVAEAVPIVSVEGGTATDIAVSNGRLSATLTGDGGAVTIRRTWFPRWEATVDGQPVPVSRDALGRMTVDVPAGTVVLNFVYAVDRVDALARLAAVLGLVLALVSVFRPAIERRVSGRPPGSDSSATG